MWYYQNNETVEIPEGSYGFVYKIKNNISGKEYIGKKFFYSSKTKQLKGKKKRVKVESDWKSYYGSNEELKNDVKTLGPENFSREILTLCSNKGECSYYETKFQFQYDVLLKPENFYNTWIMCRIHRKHLPKVLDKEQNMK